MSGFPLWATGQLRGCRTRKGAKCFSMSPGGPWRLRGRLAVATERLGVSLGGQSGSSCKRQGECKVDLKELQE